MDARLARIIGQIYEAAGDPSAWHACLESLCDLFGGTGAGLLHHDHRTDSGGVHAAARYDPEALRLYAQYYSAVDPWACGLPDWQRRLGQVVPGQAIVPHDAMVKTEFHATYRRFGHTRSLIGLVEVESTQQTSVLSVTRADHHEPFDQAEVRALSVLVPHVQRALEIHRRLVGAAQQQAVMADTLDRLSTGIVLVDAKLRPILVNAVAADILRRCDGLSIAGGEIRASTPQATQRLRGALAEAAAITAGGIIATGIIAFCVERPSGRRAFEITVTPAPPGQ
jgi:hypothetical protein